MKITITRFNIYSCLTLQHNDLQLCFDPAKIRDLDIYKISPDVILIFHESMDHMDASQVYTLHKKKKCRIFCSIACAIDLIQAFPHDYEFINNITALLPGSKLKYNNMIIETRKSIHCDYMLSLVFKVTFTDSKISVLHCFDSLISDEIIDFSKDTSLTIIPIGIAKGVSANSGLEFIQKLDSHKFVTNHLKSSADIDIFRRLVKDDHSCVFLDWNEESDISIDKVDINESISEFELKNIIDIPNSIDTSSLMWIMCNINSIRTELINNKKVLDTLFSKYESANNSEKIILLSIFISISLLDSNLISSSLVEKIENDLLKDVSSDNNSLHTVILLFLGVYAQQSGKIYGIDKTLKLVDSKNEHVTYWVTEFLGRCIVSQKTSYKNLVDEFLKIISVPSIYNSVVVRRKIFWELYRIMRVIPLCTENFVNIFEDGLTDSNPDVELLATLCFGLANRVYRLNSTQLEKIFNLLKNPEDDVRETAVKIIRGLDNKEYIISNKEKLFSLLEDSNCHVRHDNKKYCKRVEAMKSLTKIWFNYSPLKCSKSKCCSN